MNNKILIAIGIFAVVAFAMNAKPALNPGTNTNTGGSGGSGSGGSGSGGSGSGGSGGSGSGGSGALNTTVVLQQGSPYQNEVKELQAVINVIRSKSTYYKSVIAAPLVVDGSFGPNTVLAAQIIFLKPTVTLQEAYAKANNGATGGW